MVAYISFSRRSLSSTDRSGRATSPDAATLHDAELVRRFHAGDEEAFVEIIERHREKIFAIALSLLRNHADAEEIAQDTFIRAHRGLANFRGDSSLTTWLHRIALNLSRNRYWYYFRRNRHASSSFDSAFSDDNQASLATLIASDAPSPVQEAAANEFTELVAKCMELLGAGHRDILTRRNIMNCSYDDIAQSLGISIGTVKSRIARARICLRALLAKTCPDFALAASPSQWFGPARPCGHLEAIEA